MTHQSANSHSDPAILVHTNASPDNRCHHQFVNGTRCRLLTLDPDSPFCSRQAAQSDAQVIIDTDLSAAFGDEPTDFRSAAYINDFLAKLTTLLIQNRISSRRASVLAYISGLELRTLAAIEHEHARTISAPSSSTMRTQHPPLQPRTSGHDRQLGSVGQYFPARSHS